MSGQAARRVQGSAGCMRRQKKRDGKKKEDLHCVGLMDHGWGIKTNPAVPHAGSAVLMGATFMIQLSFCEAAFLTVAVLKNMYSYHQAFNF